MNVLVLSYLRRCGNGYIPGPTLPRTPGQCADVAGRLGRGHFRNGYEAGEMIRLPGGLGTRDGATRQRVPPCGPPQCCSSGRIDHVVGEQRLRMQMMFPTCLRTASRSCFMTWSGRWRVFADARAVCRRPGSNVHAGTDATDRQILRGHRSLQSINQRRPPHVKRRSISACREPVLT